MEFRENEAIYAQVAAFVTENIILEKWKAGEKLPSVRELASKLQVNPHTVVRAYDILQSRNVISNKRGIGFFIDEDALEKIKLYSREEFVSRELPEVIKSMYLYDISVQEIEKALNDYIKTINQPKNI
jgi:DNA-binding transcriptional regulator YhcF (GntR family)